MIAAVRGWLTSVICAAMVVAVAEHMAPAGGMKKIVSMTGGLVLLIMLIRPLEAVDPDFRELKYEDYAQAVALRQSELEEEKFRELQRLIEQKTAAYISDKAEELGLRCRVEVRCQTGKDGVPYPYSVAMGGQVSEEMKKWIEQELGIPAERQVFHGGEQ